MNEKQMILIGVLVVIFIAFLVVVNLLDNKSLNGIKAKKVGNGQHGTARWATKAEIKRTFIPLPFEPEMWRKGQNLPTVQGTVVGILITVRIRRTERRKSSPRPLAINRFIRRGFWSGQKRPTCRYNLYLSDLTANNVKKDAKSALFPIVVNALLCYNKRWSGSFRPAYFLSP